MSQKQIHIVNVPEPIQQHGQDQKAVCGEIVHEAIPVNIVPDVILCSVGMVASTFGRNMCPNCQLRDDPPDGVTYFMISKELSNKLRRQPEYQEAM